MRSFSPELQGAGGEFAGIAFDAAPRACSRPASGEHAPILGVEQLFHAVADLDEEEAARVLEEQCASEPALRSAVERLLRRAREVPDGFLHPTAGFASEVVRIAERALVLGQTEPE